MTRRKIDVEERFLKYTQKTESCWLWTAYKDAKGYGHLQVGRKFERAYRVSWMLYRGAIPDGVCVCHTCDNPACVNPDHLWLGTKSQNALDMHTKGRQYKGPYPPKHTSGTRGEQHPNAKLTAEKVRAIRDEATQGFSYRQLAEKYGVTVPNIGYIIRRKAWRHV